MCLDSSGTGGASPHSNEGRDALGTLLLRQFERSLAHVLVLLQVHARGLQQQVCDSNVPCANGKVQRCDALREQRARVHLAHAATRTPYVCVRMPVSNTRVGR